jgi:hypothetical protein
LSEAAIQVPARIRITDTFLAPKRLAGHLAGSTPWLGILLVSTAVSVIAVLAVPDEVFLEPMRNAVTRRGVPVEVTSDPATVVQWGRLMSMMATLATHPMVAFVIAGLVTGLFTFLGRGRGSFLEYLSLVSHGLLIPAFGTLVVLAAQVIGSIFGAGDGGGLGSLPLGLDPFIVWMLIVVGIGTSHFDQRRAPAAAIGILLAVYLGFLLLLRVVLAGDVV